MLTVSVISITVSLLFFAILIFRIKKQNIFNKKISDSVLDLAMALELVSKETSAIGELSQVISEETISLNKQSEATKDLCIGLIRNNESIAATIKIIISNQTKTSNHIQRIAIAFNKKAEADKKFIKAMHEYISKNDFDVISSKDKKILN